MVLEAEEAIVGQVHLVTSFMLYYNTVKTGKAGRCMKTRAFTQGERGKN